MADGQETATIEELTKQFSDALNAREFAKLGSMYTNDAVVCPPNANMVTGKGNIQSYWERNRVIQSLRFDSVSVKSLGDTAKRAVGTLTMHVRLNPQGGEGAAQPREMNAKYIFIWQKVDGEWKIESSIWNRIGPGRSTQMPAPARLRQASQGNTGGGMRPGGGPGGGMRPGGGPGGGMGPGGMRRPGGPGGPGAGPGGGMGPGGGPGGGPRGGGMGPGGGPRGGGMGPGPRGGGQGGNWGGGPGGRRNEGE
jgi:ketosteroid isomerase-like protein